MTDTGDILRPFDNLATDAQQRESAYRHESETRMAELQRERAWAWRRRNLLAAMLLDDLPQERDAAVDAMLRAAFRFMDLIETSLEELSEAGRETCEQLRIVAGVLHDLTHVPDGIPGTVLAEVLAAFEAWHMQRFGVSFWEQLDRPAANAPAANS